MRLNLKGFYEMKHSEVIKPEYIDRYVDIHKMLYRTLSIMVSDISFIHVCRITRS